MCYSFLTKLAAGARTLAWHCGRFGARSPVGLKPPMLHVWVWSNTRKVASPTTSVLLAAWYGRECCWTSCCRPRREAMPMDGGGYFTWDLMDSQKEEAVANE